MPRRRDLLLGALAVAAVRPAAADDREGESLVSRARRLARAPHRPTEMALPPPFAGLDYDGYRAIRPRPGAAGGRRIGGGMLTDLLPPGFFFTDRVEIVLPGASGPVPFDPAAFTFGPEAITAPPPGAPEAAEREAGYSGVRLRALLNAPDRHDEFLVFQGASYFRALARDTVYGLSARGLALGTGGPAPEEFPVFTRLEIARPHDGAVRIGALLESPSVTGAFITTTRPGAPTEMEAELTLFPRVTLREAGIAPLTSMYLLGPLRRAAADDFRPAVHDSDVLWMHNGRGETLWRPLSNPARLQVSAFLDDGPRAFGLLQTLRDFADFQDAEAHYHRRPSAVVTPRGDWGPGSVTLVEIPTRDEFQDNIVAFWRPETPLAAGGEYRFAYRLTWSAQAAPPVARPAAITASRSGVEPQTRQGRLYVVDFDAPESMAQRARLVAQLASDGAGAITGRSLYPLPGGRGLRASFIFTPAAVRDVAELRAELRDTGTGARLAPAWLHRWTRAPDGSP